MARQHDVVDQQAEQQAVSCSVLQLVLERVVPRYKKASGLLCVECGHLVGFFRQSFTFVGLPFCDHPTRHATCYCVTQHYPLQRQLEHRTTNRLSLHLLIRHIMLSNYLLHSATRIPPSATFWKLYFPEELSPSARTSIRQNLTSIY